MDVNSLSKLPVNVDLLRVSDKDITGMSKITEVQIFDNMGNFHSQGLFSITTFGSIGSAHRTKMFGYIDLKINIMHPLIYYAVTNLKSFYKQIAEGKVYAVFDNKTKEFVKSNEEQAQTGYNFFIKHVPLLEFEKNESEKRSFLIDLFYKSIKENTYLLRYLLVMPAGLRDYTVDENGKPQDDEINTFYRKTLFQSNIIDINTANKSPEIYDNIAVSLQNIVLSLFDYIKSLLDGKNKLILGKWLSRKVFNTTRNVASGSIEKVERIDSSNRIGYNSCMTGLHQFLRVVTPQSLYEIKNKYINKIFIENNSYAILPNVKTLIKEEVQSLQIQKEYDLWTSSEGIEKIIANLHNLDVRHLPVELNKGKHYLALLYRDKTSFKLFSSIDELPPHLDKSNVSPVTLAEILYMSVYHLSNTIPGLITRYPITGFGSIFPVYIKLISTIKSDELVELDDDWQPTSSVANSFPIRESEFFNTTAVHHSHFAAAALDLDGDTLSLSAVLSDEAKEEVSNYLNKKEYYISDSGKLNFSSDTDTLSAVLAYMT